jgi:glycosyltransferase involved in cell wall biosynthesis
MEAVSLRLATHILAVSEGTATHVPASLQRKVSVLENGVDVDQFDAQKNPPLTDIPAEILDGTVFRLGLVARFGEWLELDTVRDALALVSHPVKLVVFGDGPVLDAAQLEGNSTVWLAGRRPHAEVRSFLTRHCDAAIVPYNPAFAQSQVPGFFSSRKVREYLAAGLPIFFPDISGLKGELRSNPKALMYEAGAAPTLAALINRLIEEPDWHRALSVAAKRDGAAYAWDVLAEQSGFTELIKIWGES